MQPTFKQVPPNVSPFSIQTVFIPNCAPLIDATYPPGPPPITTRSASIVLAYLRCCAAVKPGTIRLTHVGYQKKKEKGNDRRGKKEGVKRVRPMPANDWRDEDERNVRGRGKRATDVLPCSKEREERGEMCEMVKGQRRTFRDQDPPRICNDSNENLKSELEFCESAPTILQRASSFEKCIGEPKYLEKDKRNKKREKVGSIKQDGVCSDSVEDSADNVRISNEQIDSPNQTNSEDFIKELSDKVPFNSRHDDELMERLHVHICRELANEPQLLKTQLSKLEVTVDGTVFCLWCWK
ncbi:hypothetical protein WN51_13392 [Melipona quadrifasciata]|uniref:Uncharacterized protein n=1 Tax=Melipona quadrifasciata TaxID=166423 RepID=A0A0M9A0W4_9HYME|nr:hypothetical protein WN51_13392 [Melipona quadrifasciata]